MTHDDDIHPHGAVPNGDMPDALRWQLRGLRRDIAPEHDLWPSIAGRIAAMPPSARASRIPRPPAWRRFAPLAVAASMVFAIGLAWQLRPVPGSETDVHARLLTVEADAMTREYLGALRVIDGTAPVPPAKELEVLDRSAAQIRTALRRDPDARFLLERLQRTYERRLELTRRLANRSLAS